MQEPQYDTALTFEVAQLHGVHTRGVHAILEVEEGFQVIEDTLSDRIPKDDRVVVKADWGVQRVEVEAEHRADPGLD